MFLEEMRKAASAYGLSLSDEQLRQFDQYQRLLLAWNERMNLTAITEPREVAVKHMVDSLSAYTPELFHDGVSVIDVGTGAGFPGIPLKIFCPGIHLTWMDALQKRVHFLQTVVDDLGLEAVACVHARAEEGARQKAYREQYDIAVSRAVARLSVLAEYCMPFVKRGGYFLALKGAKYEEELREAGKALKVMGGSGTETRRVVLPGLDDVRAVIAVHKTMPTPKAYPRKAGTPAKKPIL